MQTDSTTTERMVRSEIRAQYVRYSDRERELTNALADMYTAKRSGQPIPVVNDRQQSARARAKELLNGASHILPDTIVSGNDEEGLQIEREAVRIILTALQKEDLAAEAIEAVEWASKHKPEWDAMCRERILAVLRLNAVTDKLEKFLDRTPGAAREHLGLGWSWWDIDDADVARAIREGIVTSGDVSRARRGKGQPDGE